MTQHVKSWHPLLRGSITDQAVLAIVTVGGAGLVPIAPGTVGTLVAWGAVAGVPHWAPWAWALLGAAAFVLGTAATHMAMQRTRTHDPGWVVVDESAAYWLAFAAIGGGGPATQAALFLAFRLFDITKPWPARTAEQRLPGAWGVMVDDVVAAVYAALLVAGVRAWMA